MTQHCLPFVYDPQMGRVLDSEGTPICMVYSKNEQNNAQLIVQACNAHANLLAALKSAQRFFDEALPQFNWGASALDANAIALLNKVPSEIRRAIAKATSPQAQ